MEPTEAPVAQPSALKRKLSYMEQREWDGMETQILAAEEDFASAKEAVDNPAVFSDHTRIHTATVRMETAQHRVEALCARWAELEGKVG